MKDEAEIFEVNFGSNTIKNCGSVLKIIGKGFNKQIIRFRVGEDGGILFNCSVKDESGITCVKVANSKIQFVRQGYKADVLANMIKVWKESTGTVLLEFVQTEPRKFKLNGIFYVPGIRIMATDASLDVNGKRIIGNTFDSCSAAIGLR
jgi:hypothetical protein